jgi:hypothetical protein
MAILFFEFEQLLILLAPELALAVSISFSSEPDFFQ